MEWCYPMRILNNETSRAYFSDLDNPGDPDNNSENWTQSSSENSKWLATSTLYNGTWKKWVIKRIKEEHKQGEEFYESVIFTRSTEAPPTPSGGTFENPLPSNTIWSDGIPDGTEQLWMTYKVFYSYKDE